MTDLINHLFIDHAVQFAVLPEFISFLAGKKKIIRIVVDQNPKPFDFKLFEKYGFIVSAVSIFSVYKDNSFALLLPNADNLKPDSYQKVMMYSICKNAKDLYKFEQSEVNGDTELAGNLLGYPKCCVKNAEAISSFGAHWANYYLNDYNTHKTAHHLTNRFPIVWGGVSPIGELFPCSLSCTKAIHYAQQMISNLHDFGFQKIANVSIEHGMKTVFINEIDGAISTKNQVGYNPIIFH